MSAPLVVMADPVAAVLAYIRTIFLPSKFPSGWTAVNKTKGAPSQVIQVEAVGGDDVQHVASRERLRIQIWGPAGSSDDKARTQVARSLSAHLWRDLRANRTSGVIQLPDPADPERAISQFTIELVLHGEQES